MKKNLLPLLAAGVLLFSSCDTLTKMGLNPGEQRYQEYATVISASSVSYSSGEGIGRGRGRQWAQALTSGYSQIIIIQTESGRTFRRHVTLNSDSGYSVGDTGVAEIGVVSNTCWGFTPN